MKWKMVNVAKVHFYNLHDLLISNADPNTQRKTLRIKRTKIRQKAQHDREAHEALMFEYYHILFKEYLISLLDTLKFLRDNDVDLNKVVDIDIDDDNGTLAYHVALLDELNRIRDEYLDKQEQESK